MRKKFLIIFLALTCLIAIGFKFCAQKNPFYSKNTTKMQNKNTASKKNVETIDEKLKKRIVLINSDKDKDGIKDQEVLKLPKPWSRGWSC